MAATRPRPPQLFQTPLPSSPPELTSSKSSKSSSSSFRSSIISDSAGPENLTHFEDISLEDSKRDSYDLNTPTGKHSRPVRPLRSMMGSRNKSQAAVDTMRSPHSAQRPHSPSARARPLEERDPNTPMGRPQTYRHNSTSPTTRFSASRSPSPTKSLNRDLRRSSTSSSTLGPNGPVRRSSWIPGQRKTIKELEDEYNDEDEDVPDDAVMWNVPLSPLGPFTSASRTPSPHRQDSTPIRPFPALDRRAPVSAAPHSARKPDDLRRKITLRRSATEPMLSETGSDSLRDRHQSWTEHLSLEARELSLALDAHLNNEQTSSRRVSGGLLKRTATTLPPVQKSNIMIDPLPISKEKEAVLSRTRPSWLPPKSLKEERRHLRQWEAMMAASVMTERKRAAKQHSTFETTRFTSESASAEWTERILPNFASAIREPRTRELWWRGIPARHRGTVWSRAIGNDLALTPASYTVALARDCPAPVLAAITTDAPDAFPETGLFTPTGPLHQSLIQVLTAYASYRPDIGYAPGLHRVAALLLLNMSAEQSFVAMANLLNRALPLARLTGSAQATDKWAALALSTLKLKMPALHDHLLAVGVKPADLTAMAGALFTSTLELDALTRLWDVWVFEGDKVLVRAVVGVLSLNEAKLYGSKEEVLAVLGGRVTQEAELVMASVREAGKSGGRQRS